MSKISTISPTKIRPESILFLLRAYNEESRITGVIDSIMTAGFRKILVINDGSRDATESLVRTHHNCIVISHSHNRGAGAALETGFEFLRRNALTLWIEYVVTFDADGQHDIADIGEFIRAFEKDPDLDIVFGSRFIRKTQTNVPFIRRCILWWGKIFTWIISGIKLTDSHNGYRMHHMKAVSVVSLTMDGMEYASELIEQVRIHWLTFAEVPVNIRYDDYTLAKGQKHGGVWRIVSKIIVWKWFR
jgi:polyprenyl-phospho-N-acetylgalactosaminyl synthase